MDEVRTCSGSLWAVVFSCISLIENDLNEKRVRNHMVSNIQGVASNYVSCQTAARWRMYSDQVVLQYKWSSSSGNVEKTSLPERLGDPSLGIVFDCSPTVSQNICSTHHVFNYQIRLMLFWTKDSLVIYTRLKTCNLPHTHTHTLYANKDTHTHAPGVHWLKQLSRCGSYIFMWTASAVWVVMVTSLV